MIITLVNCILNIIMHFYRFILRYKSLYLPYDNGTISKQLIRKGLCSMYLKTVKEVTIHLYN